MGNYFPVPLHFGQSDSNVENLDLNGGSTYRYPPKSGNASI